MSEGHEPYATAKNNAGTMAWYREPTALEIALGGAIADALIDAVLADDTTKAKVLAKVILDARKRVSKPSWEPLSRPPGTS